MTEPTKRPSRRTWAALVIVAVAIFFLFLSFLDRRSPVNVDPPYNRTTGASDN